MDTDQYDVDAKADCSDGPIDLTRYTLMVQSMLEDRFQVKSHTVLDNGLNHAEISLLDPEPQHPIGPEYDSLVRLLEVLIERIGEAHFPVEKHFDDASWVSYRLAEILPLKLTIKQTMLEINDSNVRMKVLAQFLKQQGLV